MALQPNREDTAAAAPTGGNHTVPSVNAETAAKLESKVSQPQRLTRDKSLHPMQSSRALLHFSPAGTSRHEAGRQALRGPECRAGAHPDRRRGARTKRERTRERARARERERESSSSSKEKEALSVCTQRGTERVQEMPAHREGERERGTPAGRSPDPELYDF